MNFDFLDSRPVIVALAGSNGAGKSTFYRSQLADSGLPFINADDIARNLGIDAYEAADVATTLRNALVTQRESFIFETVLSDPVGDKIQFLRQASESGYAVALIFIQIDSVETSI